VGRIVGVLAYERTGTGEPLVLLHGTNCSRAIWDPMRDALSAQRDVVAIDLPAHGASPVSALTPAEFAVEIGQLFDALDLSAPAVVGHSVGGWTALELATRGRAGAVLALAPAGLWRTRSPLLTDLTLRATWRLGQLLGDRMEAPLRTRVGRTIGLRSVSARPGRVPAELALSLARDARASRHFPEHFAATRVLRFVGGAAIPATVPVHVVWGDDDRIALAGRSRFTDELPSHAVVETWGGCGHMLMWDRAADTIAAALQTTVRR
jgi:pimeloyl-ACP methyl ester carboxylesterase